MSDTNRPRVQQRAYEIWERDQCPEGKALDHWLTAEQEIADEDTATAEGMATPDGPVAIQEK
jgi:hypothetical protein